MENFLSYFKYPTFNCYNTQTNKFHILIKKSPTMDI